ncbi:transmembrane protein 154 isoform X2 [Phodopus roborovskii]|uniref:transmembrane protein 154 isoform X2 n=1 Tax=Phodopus roborovskii TaxID=109678 RepID=UPI0021E50716|nr:transmembrane protein 154 isoform X2 [Phodopus roborovskii]
MTALCIALVLALGLAFGRSDQGNDEELELSGHSTTEEEKVDKETTSALAVVTTEALTTDTNSTYTEPSSQGSQSVLQTYEPIGENLKVPIFEEDTPSVMEIEMDELDKWMSSMNRKADYECLPTLKEEKEPNLSQSDNES